MEKKSNNDKYKDAVYKNGEADNLFRISDAAADVILKYCDNMTLLNVLVVNKSWNKKINEFKLVKRQEYLKYFLWYVYGCGNAERLCKIVNDVVNEHKNEIGDDENKKFLFWHMVLLDILNIKATDLKLDFEKEKAESIEKAIKNCLLTKKAVKRRNDFIDAKKIMSVPNSSEPLLWEYSRQIFSEFKNIQLELKHVDLGFIKYSSYKYMDMALSTKKLLRNVFTCFFKVSFYQMQIVKNLDEYKDNQLVYKKHGNQIYDFNRYLREKIFGYVYGEDINFSKYMAAYLFETGELDQWFLNYKKDFFDFFCRKNSFDKLNEDESNIKFGYFAFYLNKIKPLQTRYKENSNKFWQDFLIDIVKKDSDIERNMLKYDITPYISKKSLKNKMKIEIMQMTGYSNEYLEASRHGVPYFFHHDFLIYRQSDAEKNYFNPIIIRFCGQKDLKENVIQSISYVIENKDEDKINNASNKLNGKNKIGFWQHCLFGLFLALTCLSLFLCFKISLYFLVLFFISLIICSCLGFKNYCSCCHCSKKIETPLIDQEKNSLNKIYSNEQKSPLIDSKLNMNI